MSICNQRRVMPFCALRLGIEHGYDTAFGIPTECQAIIPGSTEDLPSLGILRVPTLQFLEYGVMKLKQKSRNLPSILPEQVEVLGHESDKHFAETPLHRYKVNVKWISQERIFIP